MSGGEYSAGHGTSLRFVPARCLGYKPGTALFPPLKGEGKGGVIFCFASIKTKKDPHLAVRLSGVAGGGENNYELSSFRAPFQGEERVIGVPK
jgi:hypothetical protein